MFQSIEGRALYRACKVYMVTQTAVGAAIGSAPWSEALANVACPMSDMLAPSGCNPKACLGVECNNSALRAKHNITQLRYTCRCHGRGPIGLDTCLHTVATLPADQNSVQLFTPPCCTMYELYKGGVYMSAVLPASQHFVCL